MAASATGVKLFAASYGRLCFNAGTVPCAVAVKRRVWPSGGALATVSVPMAPLAPALFSTTTATFRRSASRGCSNRAITSAPVAGVNGTTIVTARVG